MHASSTLLLRNALSSDRAFLLALYVDTRAPEFAHLGWGPETARPFMEMQFDAQRSDYARRHRGAGCQVVELRGERIGRLWVAEEARGLVVLDISLLSPWRGQGLGGDCLRRVLRRADAAQQEVELQVVRGNPAQRLYKRLGFRPVGGDDLRVAMMRRPEAPTQNTFEEMHDEQA